jgi:polyisoprenoid-binding protein YceI
MFPTKWSIDPASSKLTFSVNSHNISVLGKFTTFHGTVYTTGNDFLTAKIELSVDANSICTGHKNRDGYLINNDLLDVASFPKIIFASDSIKETETNGTYELSGTLTIKAITKPILLIARSDNTQNQPGNDEAFFAVTATIDRKNWSLDWYVPYANDGLVTDEIVINCEIRLLKCEQPTRKETVSGELDNAVPAEYIL